MNKMVNNTKLRLKQTIIRRFVSEINDSDDESSDSEVCCLSADLNGSDLKTNGDNGCPPMTDGLEANKQFSNLKILVRIYGEREERFVNGLALRSELDQLVECKDLHQMETVLWKTKDHPKPKGPAIGRTEDKAIEANDNRFADESLELQGIRRLNRKKYKCFVCESTFNWKKQALKHIQSDKHSKNIFGDDLKGLDALFTIDSETIGDAQTAIARKTELKKISSNDKQNYLNHGIRLKDGMGANAYICANCNLCFQSLTEVENHMQTLDAINDKPLSVRTTDSPTDKRPENSGNALDDRLRNEGIKCTAMSDENRFYCCFCNIYFDCKKTVVTHMRDPRHRRIKFGENLNEMDTNFTVKSDRIHEFEVAFARKNFLRNISPESKLQFTRDSIRLKDGIGSNAFVCEKCNFPIDSFDRIGEHIKSLIHSIDK